MMKLHTSLRNPALIALTLSLILGLGWFAFAPGLSGPFFFDDQIHLPKLAGSGNGIHTPDEVMRLILPDDGGSGRSLSYLSLLVDDNGWPTSPQAFKRTNLLLHLLNGVLVFVFLRGLTRLLQPAGATTHHADWVALAGAALWLLHPLHLSPIMMVIQRMTLLGGTFSLLALIAYLHGRGIAAERPWTALFWLGPVFGACLVLGILSKETAFMTLAYVATLELTVLGANRPPRPAWWRAWSAVFLILPLILLGLYFATVFSTMADAYQARAFNLSERLMTEGRVLMQYLRVILLPSLSESTPFRDDFAISRGLLDPPQTLAALGAIALLLALAILKRRAWPLFALAILWFFLGHLLEGTVLPLEIYFEHRNYLPMLGPIFALCYAVFAVPLAYRHLLTAGLLGMIALVGAITWSSARVWGNARSIAILWSAERPASHRAQVVAINYWANQGDWGRLRTQLDQATAAQPTNANLPLFRYALEHCTDARLPSLGADVEEIARVAQTAPLDFGSLEGLKWIIDRDRDGHCRIDPKEIQRIFDIYLASPKFTASPMPHRQLATLLASYRQQQGDLDGTIRALDRAYAASPSFTTALDQAYFLMSAGLLDDARHYVDIAVATPPRNLFQWLERDRRLAAYQDFLRDKGAQNAAQAHDAKAALEGEAQTPRGH
ncbi:hypothetical protein [Candidatus Thiodictyon syntrophicum]|jgi:hypothetical protein|uniref:Tetratricopeptide repeat protein n=1 Tax=Candidatus Thiodictyon syntrophicum TaxID=1166950 RepID=A0A2K8UEZ2_9GAMM|nr:hypothetical protein [Candidatus Thiodictyon syntrophicum]AUB84156.1 hypothetical protein THSYN_26600 [Candidatus Thiodictyon syntrophicum]